MKISSENGLNLHIEKNKIQDSFISRNVLWQCRDIVPERKIVGKDDKGNIIFFEETSGSLQRRHYGRTSKASSFNLLYSDGIKSSVVTKDYLQTASIDFNGGYNREVLFDFITNNNHRFNALKGEKRRKYCIYVSDSELVLVKEFLEKMRMYKNENN